MSDKEKSERRESDLEKDVFVHWLASSDDIFWITGKAGCGKSTLMKLIDDDPRTKEGLNQWIDNRCVRDEEWWIQSGLVRGCCAAHDESLDKSVQNGADSLEVLATLRARKLSEDLKGMLNSIKQKLPETSEGKFQTETHDNRVNNLGQLKDSMQYEPGDTLSGAEASLKAPEP
jgi:ATPase subunit of ABC transporter with duplicated ATPase domains